MYDLYLHHPSHSHSSIPCSLASSRAKSLRRLNPFTVVRLQTQPTSSALPPTNPHANSIHYPRAEHYPMERAYSMPQVGGGGPPTPAPLQQHYYTPQMPPAPQNHSFTFTQSTLQKSQRRDDQQSLPRPGNDQRPPRAQYQLTFPINGNSSHRRSQMPPPLTISIPNSTTIFNNLCHNLETTSGRPTHNTNLRSPPLLIPRSITRGTLKYKGTMVNHSLIFNRRKRSFQGHKVCQRSARV
ncbi:hypothetical protein CPB85DRAFT_592652 [Mucidula mucida]|nr:hypothetical protein CPB85DRAFT_592652 [Mucidula mucida]